MSAEIGGSKLNWYLTRKIINMVNRELEEPLLSQENNDDVEGPLVRTSLGDNCSADIERDGSKSDIEDPFLPNDSDSEDPCLSAAATDPDANVEGQQEFSVRKELWEMANLGLPLAVSFFCRMGMASTDSSFVGHINDGIHSPETYLAAAVLSDMCVNVLLVPPLAFNQVLNALVGQAMGSDNPKMAGIWLQQSMFWLTVTMLPCLLGLFYVEPMLRALDFPLDVSQVAGTYAMYNVFWPVPNGLYQCMRFYFQAQGLPRPAMYNNMVFLLVNAMLNYVFVFGGPFRHFSIFGHWKGIGFIGAAVSLSISRTMQGVVYFIYMFVYKKHHKATWPGLSWEHHTWARTMEFMKQSLPNVGTLLFQQCASQATTVLVGRLGERAIATSSALSTVMIPWGGTLSATTSTVSSVRVGYHLGRGDEKAANRSAWLVIHFITCVSLVMSVVCLLFRHDILDISTNDKGVLSLGVTLIPAVLVGTYLNLLVGNITSGVFSGMGRPFITTILSFGFELPLSIGGVALYILKFHGDLLGVYWLTAILGAFEAVVVVLIMCASDWQKCADEARRRQESPATVDESPETIDLITRVDEESLSGN